MNEEYAGKEMTEKLNNVEKDMTIDENGRPIVYNRFEPPPPETPPTEPAPIEPANAK
jgi:hypothetical protein